MNPGPAPRPPTDRRPPNNLSLLPSIAGYPGNNMSTTSLNSPSVRSNSTATGTTSLTMLSRTNSMDPFQAASAVKQGMIKYKEDGFGQFLWKTKWAVLRQNTIDFQKAEGAKIAFSIILAHVTGVQRWDAIPLCIELVRAANPSAHPGVPLKDQPQRTMYMKFDRDDDLYEWQDEVYTRCPAISGVSNPTNFSHRVHVGFDPTTGGFLGLPPEWEKLLTASAITQDDYLRHPQAVIEVLEFYTDIANRAEKPDQFPSLTPTPPLQTNQNMQLGHGGGGNSIAPPRPLGPSDRSASFSSSQPRFANTPPRSLGGTPVQGQRNASGPATYGQNQLQNMQQGPASEKLGMGGEMRRAMEEEAKRIKDQQERERQRNVEEQNRKDQEAYNAAIPKQKTSMAKQELGGYGSSSEAPRYNPVRAAPAAPGSDRSRQQPQTQTSRQAPTQRQVPPASENLSSSGPIPPRAPFAQSGSSSREHSPGAQASLRTPRADQQVRQAPSSSRQAGTSNERNNSPQTQPPPQASTTGNTPPSRLPAPVQQVQPLKVSKPVNGQAAQQKADAVKQTEAALTAKPEARQKEVRMSSMSESEVMAKLKKIVTRYDPSDSYVKQKKIGQGASGSVYIAKVRSDASSPVGKSLYRRDGADARVAIKTMDLRHQPRKELIVNEIIVMKESVHPNIVNYLDSFLIENDSELWVIMEYMNGGALTDVIENNPAISEDQIAAICNEVSAVQC